MSKKRSKTVPPPTNSELPYREIMDDDKINELFDSANRILTTVSNTLQALLKEFEKPLKDKGKATRITRQINNLSNTINNLKNFKTVGLQAYLSNARVLTALEIQNYRGQIGTNNIDGFEFHSQHEPINLLRSQRSKATPQMPSIETLEQKAAVNTEIEQNLIAAEASLLYNQLSDAEWVAAQQRGAYMLYSNFINDRIQKQLCRNPDALLKALAGMAMVQQYYLSHGPHVQTQPRPEAGSMDGLKDLREVPAPPHPYGFY